MIKHSSKTSFTFHKFIHSKSYEQISLQSHEIKIIFHSTKIHKFIHSKSYELIMVIRVMK